jgi:hypothetical protein
MNLSSYFCRTALVLFVAGCEKAPADPVENATPSPNASILPAPLSSTGQPAAETPALGAATASSGLPAEAAGKLASSDAAVAVPQALRGDQPPDDDPLTQRELQGVTLEGEWRYPDLPVPPKAPEANAAGIDAARKLTLPRMTIDLANSGRMRVIFDSRALPVGQGAEIRARIDRYGHLLVWPTGSQYRVLPPGAVRTLLGERRVDAIPLVRAQSLSKAEGTHRLGLPTKKWDIVTRTGKLILEQARIASAGEGGTLFCRFLSEIIAIDPSAAPCAGDDVPLRAQFIWPQGGTVVFEVSALNDKSEFSSGQLLVPPSGADFTPASLPPGATGSFLTRDELAAFRLRPLDVGYAPGPGAPDDGLLLHNGTDVLRYAFLESVPVAWVPPNRDQAVPGLLRGRYLIQWRTFLGETVDPPAIVDLPARVAVGFGADGGRDR